MFLGHFAVAMAAKKVAPKTSLGILVAAAQLADLLWPVLLLLGVERVAIAPGITEVTPLDFQHYPYSHSLAWSAVWAALAGVAWARWRGDRIGAVTIAVLVLSHWALDAISHRPDVPLMPDGPYLGGGLWFSVPATLAVEFALFGTGIAIYRSARAAGHGPARWNLTLFSAVLIATWLASVFGPPPPSVDAIATACLLGWLFIWWAHRLDAQRRPA
jgi:membrane-bound metal-dependent hydrolase YbcI (DUF457 family)